MTPPDVTIRPLQPGESPACEAVLRALPDWFGIESSLLQYVADSQRYPTWLALHGPQVIGFVTLNRHFPEAGEIHCLAVRPEFHDRGVGRALVQTVEQALRISGAGFMQVKTMGPSRPSESYARTLAFYRAVGFVPLEEIHGLWGRHPVLAVDKINLPDDLGCCVSHTRAAKRALRWSIGSAV